MHGLTCRINCSELTGARDGERQAKEACTAAEERAQLAEQQLATAKADCETLHTQLATALAAANGNSDRFEVEGTGAFPYNP